MNHGFFQHCETKLHYVEFGPTTGPLVFLLHGWPEFWFAWRKQAPVFAKHGFRCIVPDLPGFGQSTAPSRFPQDLVHYTFKAVCVVLAHLMDSLRCSKATFIGHDWGGALVWRMALFFPHRVRAVGSVCSPYRPSTRKYVSPEQIAEKMPQFHYQVYFSDQCGERAAKEFEAQPNQFFRLALRSSDELQARLMRKQDETFLATGQSSLHRSDELPPSKLLSEEELQEYLAAYAHSGFRTTMAWYNTSRKNWEDEASVAHPTISVPALVITCGKDQVLVPAMTAGMEDWVPNLARHHIEDAGHWVLAERSELITPMLLTFLQKNSPPSSKL